MNRRNFLKSLGLLPFICSGAWGAKQAITPTLDARQRLCIDYVDNILKYCQCIPNRDEDLMGKVEEILEIPVQCVDDLRRMIAAQVGYLAFNNIKIEWNFNSQLATAFTEMVETGAYA